MSRFLSTLGFVVSILLLLQFCSYDGRMTNSKEIEPIVEPPLKSNNRIFCRIAAIFTSMASNNNVESDVFSDIPTYSDRKKSQRFTDTAKILAGMNIGNRSDFANLETAESWQEHRQFLNSAWSQIETQRLDHMREWQATELNSLKNVAATIFYPFSDANFLDVYTLFPQGKLFILIGLEPVGKIPYLSELTIAEIADILKSINYNLYETLSLSYFRPPQIVNTFDREAIAALYVFLVRTNNRIYDVKYFSLEREGKISLPQSGKLSGIKIVFAPEGDTERKTIYYFSSKLSNEALSENPELVAFINRQNPKITYLDAAAYLMHFDSFSQIKNLILAQSNYILQDDSGLPLTAFKPEKWDLKFYGNYTQPEIHFSDRYQPQLWQIYNSRNDIKPLKFATGYQSEAKNSNLILARDKNNFKNNSFNNELPVISNK